DHRSAALPGRLESSIARIRGLREQQARWSDGFGLRAYDVAQQPGARAVRVRTRGRRGCQLIGLVAAEVVEVLAAIVSGSVRGVERGLLTRGKAGVPERHGGVRRGVPRRDAAAGVPSRAAELRGELRGEA